MAKQTLSLVNIEGGELVEDADAVFQKLQDAVFASKGKGSMTIKINMDGSKNKGGVVIVGYDVSSSPPRVKKSTLYNRGAHYLVAEPVLPVRGKQEEMAEVVDITTANRAVN